MVMKENHVGEGVPAFIIRQVELVSLGWQHYVIKWMEDTFYHQITGTAMGSPFAPNYVNLFMGKFETLSIITMFTISILSVGFVLLMMFSLYLVEQWKSCINFMLF